MTHAPVSGTDLRLSIVLVDHQMQSTRKREKVSEWCLGGLILDVFARTLLIPLRVVTLAACRSNEELDKVMTGRTSSELFICITDIQIMRRPV